MLSVNVSLKQLIHVSVGYPRIGIELLSTSHNIGTEQQLWDCLHDMVETRKNNLSAKRHLLNRIANKIKQDNQEDDIEWKIVDREIDRITSQLRDLDYLQSVDVLPPRTPKGKSYHQPTIADIIRRYS